MITKSKIKTFNNSNNYLKKYKGGNNVELTQKIENEGEESENTETNTSSENSENLKKNLIELINQLITNCEKAMNINIDENDDSIQICEKISNYNILGEFHKNLYKELNENLKDKKNINIDGYNLLVKEKKEKKLNLVVFSKIIHGKVGSDWPPIKQKDLFKESFGITMKNRAKNKLKKLGKSFSGLFGKKKKDEDEEEGNEGNEQGEEGEGNKENKGKEEGKGEGNKENKGKGKEEGNKGNKGKEKK